MINVQVQMVVDCSAISRLTIELLLAAERGCAVGGR